MHVIPTAPNEVTTEPLAAQFVLYPGRVYTWVVRRSAPPMGPPVRADGKVKEVGKVNEVSQVTDTIWGRALRIILGLVLLGIGIGVAGAPPLGIALVGVGLVAIAMGARGHCLVEAVTLRHAA